MVFIRSCFSTLRPFLLCVCFVLPLVGGSALAQSTGQQHNEGASVFKEARCYACHGTYGEGTIGPAFSGDRMLSLKSYVVSQILVGGGIMPPFAGKLTDSQIAAVAEYIRNNWGNHFGPVSPEEVAQARKQLGEAEQQTSAPTRPTARKSPMGR